MNGSAGTHSSPETSASRISNKFIVDSKALGIRLHLQLIKHRFLPTSRYLEKMLAILSLVHTSEAEADAEAEAEAEAEASRV